MHSAEGRTAADEIGRNGNWTKLDETGRNWTNGGELRGPSDETYVTVDGDRRHTPIRA